jgi:hypothetical protein
MFAADPTLDVVANTMLNALNPYLPAPASGLPKSTVSIASMVERAVGIGKQRGSDLAGTFPITLKGIRLDALARFQLWASGPAEADQKLGVLNNQIMADRDKLRAAGFLRLALVDTPPADPFLDTVGGWRKNVDYRVLYEFDYGSTDGAQGLIARIPVRIDGQLNESMTITDAMTRWDNTKAPPLAVRGPGAVNGLSVLDFLPGSAPSGPVTLTRTFDGAKGTPAVYANLPKFLAAVAGNNAADLNAKVTFSTYAQFRAAFKGSGPLLLLGDWNKDGVLDQYRPAVITIDPPIELLASRDRFEASYDNGRKFNKTGVAYLRAT